MPELKHVGSLPNELQLLIYENVVDSCDWEEAKEILHICQFLCKSWLRTAQIALYRDVRLPPESIESFGKALHNSRDTTWLGHFVKSVKFYPSAPRLNEKFPPNIGQLIDVILNNSPYIETIGSSTSTAFEDILWDRLLQTADDQLECLEQFTLRNEWSAAKTSIYGNLNLKFKKSLIMLQLYPDPKSDDVNQDVNFTALKRNLKGFVSLKELQLCGDLVRSPIIAELDGLINDCSRTTHSLLLSDCTFLHTHDYPNEIKANSSIKTLKLQSPKLSAASLCYLAKKLSGLETLTVTGAVFDLAQPETQEQYGEWWNLMTELCQRLQDYDIKISDFKFGKSLEQIRRCVHMTKTIANHATHGKENNSTGFTMYLGYSEVQKRDYIIEMKQNDSYFRLFDPTTLFQHDVSLFDVFEAIEPLSPQTINILDVDCSFDFEVFLSFIHQKDATPETREVIFENNQTFGVKNWSIFKSVMSLIKDKNGSVVYLDKMAFPGSLEGFDPIIEQEVISESTSISQLSLTRCLFYSNVLSNMLSRLSKIDTLLLYRCIIQSNSLHQLDIDLPETRLGRLELDSNSLARSSDLFSMHGHVHIYLKIGTVETKICKEVGYGYQRPDLSPNFCISINCKDLRSLVISGKEVFTSPVIELSKIPSIST